MQSPAIEQRGKSATKSKRPATEKSKSPLPRIPRIAQKWFAKFVQFAAALRGDDWE
jgi:hypothetical protein